MVTPVTQALGARWITRHDYLNRLQRALTTSASFR
jgi:Leu/Phe-tRNA-protein transferase